MCDIDQKRKDYASEVDSLMKEAYQKLSQAVEAETNRSCLFSASSEAQERIESIERIEALERARDAVRKARTLPEIGKPEARPYSAIGVGVGTSPQNGSHLVQVNGAKAGA